MIEEILKKCNLKVTKNRIQIYNTIRLLDDKSTLKNIYNKTNIDKVTIYRILELYVNNNIIVKNIINNDIYYSLNTKDHHHYMTCIKCHSKIKIDICPIDLEIKKLCKDNGFMLTSHSLNLEGICSSCLKK